MPVLHVAGQVEVHQAVGGADLHFGVVILGGEDQGDRGCARRSVSCLTASTRTSALGFLRSSVSLGNRRSARLADLAHVLGADILRGSGSEQEQTGRR